MIRLRGLRSALIAGSVAFAPCVAAQAGSVENASGVGTGRASSTIAASSMGSSSTVSAAPIIEEPGSVADGPEVEVMRELIPYLFTPGTNIATASGAQTRWLTPELNAELEGAYRRCAEAAAAHPDEHYDLPSNSDFYDSWDPPTAFRFLGSRVYGTQAFVDVEYAWGPDTNYPGDRRTISYVLAFVDSAWKIDDVLTIRDEFASPGSLSAAYRDMPR